MHIHIDIDLYTPMGRAAFRCRPLHHGIVRCMLRGGRPLHVARTREPMARPSRSGRPAMRMRRRTGAMSGAALAPSPPAQWLVRSKRRGPSERTPSSGVADQQGRTRSQRDGVRATCSSVNRADGGGATRHYYTYASSEHAAAVNMPCDRRHVVDGLSTAGARARTTSSREERVDVSAVGKGRGDPLPRCHGAARYSEYSHRVL